MRFRLDEAGTMFMVGTMTNPPNADSRGCDGLWCVNCINMWAATLGNKLNQRNAVLEHLVIVLHEITHAISNVFHKQEDDPHAWDTTLKRILLEFTGDENDE